MLPLDIAPDYGILAYRLMVRQEKSGAVYDLILIGGYKPHDS